MDIGRTVQQVGPKARRDWRTAVLGVVAALMLGGPVSHAQMGPVMSRNEDADPMRSPTWRGDARLNDVCFLLDCQRGWACGDRGTIWYTEDGGTVWTLQDTPTIDSLHSICFVDALNGWAVGGRIDPYTWTTSGTVLTTRDGGRTWTEQRNHMLPMLRQVRFVDARRGWAVGHTSETFATGIFLTDDGGRSWQALPATRSPGWVAADLLAPDRGALLGQDGSAWILSPMRAQPSNTPQFGLRQPMCVALNPTGSGWMVGQGGLVMQTLDAGRQWIVPTAPLPPGVADTFDFHAVAAVAPGHAWIAGAPGTRVFRTRDFGNSWEAIPTGQTAPIRALRFVDAAHGWAVGEFGTILVTGDGGATWTVQRQGAHRAAILCIVAEPEDAPLEMITYLSGNEGYTSIVAVLGRRDLEAPPRVGVYPSDRSHQAVVLCGGCGAEHAWRFPLRQPGLGLSEPKILEGWDTANDGKGRARFQAELVRAIRMWRPSILVTRAPAASTAERDTLAFVIGRELAEAVRSASDPLHHAEQLTQAGLEPWAIDRLHLVTPPGTIAELNLDTAELAIRLGRSIRDASAEPVALVSADTGPRPQLVGFQTLIGQTPQIPARPDLLAGLRIMPGDGARRPQLTPPLRGLETLKRTAAQRRNLRAILEHSVDDPRRGLEIMGQISSLVSSLDDDSAARVLFELGQRYHRSGQWDLAAGAFEAIVQRHQRHPLASPAAIWLVQYHTSKEAAWRVHWKNRSPLAAEVASSTDAQTAEAMSNPSVTWHVAGPVHLASATSAAAKTSIDLASRAERASVWAQNIKNLLPDVFADPRIGFPLAVVQRERGFPNDARRYYLTRQHSLADEAWARVAEGELWLADRHGASGQKCPRPLAICPRSMHKPYLDGRLGDEIWREAAVLEPRSPLGDDQAWPSRVLIARDNDHLYIAISCAIAPGANYETDHNPRPRDPDLESRDRVDILLDIDRDYATYYHFTVDYRGWAADSCWGDMTWDPTWFIAAERGDRTWTAEIAIPFRELLDQPPRPDACWAIGVQRTVPNVGFQSWNTPARQTIQPEGFGLLLFE